MRPRVGDKVRLKTKPNAGRRGVTEGISGSTLIIRLEDDGECIQASSGELTNLSLAARRAWLTMPKRDVGRPKGLRLSDRVSVTLRIDRELWEQFKALEQVGRITDRTATINEWLSERLEQLTEKNGDECQIE
jgi:hypothetical protein